MSEGRTASTREVLMQIFDAYSRGDLDTMAALIDEDIEWQIDASPELYPFGGQKKGRSAVIEALKQLGGQMEMLEYKTLLSIVDGPLACFLNRCRVRDRSTTLESTVDLCDLGRVENGRVVWFREILDTLDVTERLKGGRARFDG